MNHKRNTSKKQYTDRRIIREVEKMKIKFGGMSPSSINNISNKINNGGFHSPADIVLYQIVESIFKQNRKKIADKFLDLVCDVVQDAVDVNMAFESNSNITYN